MVIHSKQYQQWNQWKQWRYSMSRSLLNSVLHFTFPIKSSDCHPSDIPEKCCSDVHWCHSVKLTYIALKGITIYKPESPPFGVRNRARDPTHSCSRPPSHLLCVWVRVCSHFSLSTVNVHFIFILRSFLDRLDQMFHLMYTYSDLKHCLKSILLTSVWEVVIYFVAMGYRHQ